MARTVIFSGGTAFKETARELARRGRAVTYAITTFDSGGSSQALRQVFAMPAVGDLRNRLLAIARNEAAANMLNRRLSANAAVAWTELENINLAELLSEIAVSARKAIGTDLRTVIAALPMNFNPARASLGNLAIAGAWLRNGHDLLKAVRRYENLLQCVGEALPICKGSLHIAAQLSNGHVARQQHLFASLTDSIENVFLIGENGEPARPEALPEVLDAIAEADLIFYPMGSFYSSVVANFLPQGVAKAVAASAAHKIFIPNMGRDPESRGLTIAQQARIIIRILSSVVGRQDNLINSVLADAMGDYPGGITPAVIGELESMNIQFLPAKIAADNGETHNPADLATAIEWMMDFA